MKSLIISLVVFPALVSSMSQAQVVAHYSYSKAKNPVKKTISLQELKTAYKQIKDSTFNPPAKEVFFEDYLRFKLGVELALNDKKLVKTPKIDEQIANPYLKQAFHQELYKALAEEKLKKQTKNLDKKASQLSESALKKLYSKEPEFNIFFIAIYHPISPNPSQIQEAKKRADQIYSQVIKSKKPFVELVTLYSDDKSNGVLNINRSKAAIFPSAYKQLKKMKANSISRPIRVPSGYVIVRLNRKVPFSESNQTAIRANYFNQKRTELFNQYFNSLKKRFSIRIINKDLIKNI